LITDNTQHTLLHKTVNKIRLYLTETVITIQHLL